LLSINLDDSSFNQAYAVAFAFLATIGEWFILLLLGVQSLF